MSLTLIELEDEFTRLTLAPELGASIVNWTVRSTGQPLLRHSDAHALNTGLPGKLGCFPLIPWSNRIADGGFDCPDGWLALAPNSLTDPLPIHGSAWQQVWDVVSRSENEVVLQLDGTTPFAYRARQRFHLSAGKLSIELLVTHLAEHAAWHGLGLHPYLPRTANTRLQAPARHVWLCDRAKLPTELSALPLEWDFQHLKALPESLVDNGFCEWNGHCLIEQADVQQGCVEPLQRTPALVGAVGGNDHRGNVLVEMLAQMSHHITADHPVIEVIVRENQLRRLSA